MVENLAVDAAPGRVLVVLAAIATAVLAMIAVPRETAAPRASLLCPMIRAGVSAPRAAIETRYRGLNPRYLQREAHRR